MNICLRLLGPLLKKIHEDLSRSHPFAAERVGFMTCGVASQSGPGILLLGEAWHAVADDDYIEDDRVGACIGGGAFRRLFQTVYREPATTQEAWPGRKSSDECRARIPGGTHTARVP